MNQEYVQQLKELLQLEKRATQGPWVFKQMMDGIDSRVLIDKSGYVFGKIDDCQNGEFIAASMNAIPAIVYLIAKVVELEDKLEEAYSIFNG